MGRKGAGHGAGRTAGTGTKVGHGGVGAAGVTRGSAGGGAGRAATAGHGGGSAAGGGHGHAGTKAGHGEKPR